MNYPEEANLCIKYMSGCLGLRASCGRWGVSVNGHRWSFCYGVQNVLKLDCGHHHCSVNILKDFALCTLNG